MALAKRPAKRCACVAVGGGEAEQPWPWGKRSTRKPWREKKGKGRAHKSVGVERGEGRAHKSVAVPKRSAKRFSVCHRGPGRSSANVCLGKAVNAEGLA